MIEKRYTWKFNHGVPAHVAGDVILAIEKRDGSVTKASLLEASRPEDSPTHKCFEWDDHKAAEQWRLNQAGAIIRDLQIEYVDSESDSEPTVIPMFVNVKPSGLLDEGVYKSAEIAVRNENDNATIISNAIRDLEKFKKKYETIASLKGIISDINSAIEKLKAKA